MRFRPFFVCVALLPVAIVPGRAQDSRTAAKQAPASSAQKDTRRTSRGPLPDPALLDGSTQAPEKKPEYGMLGEFEMPGDENAKDGKVGGQQSPQGAAGGQAGAQGAQGAQGSMPPGAMPQGGGAAGGAPPPPGGQPPQGAMAGGAAPAQNDPNAKAEGVQVAGLQGDPADGAAGAGGAQPPGGQKPQPIAQGDPTMRIKPAANAPNVVGAVTAGNTQQMETKVGGGSGGGTSSGTGRNNSEKGRVMPAGL